MDKGEPTEASLSSGTTNRTGDARAAAGSLRSQGCIAMQISSLNCSGGPKNP